MRLYPIFPIMIYLDAVKKLTNETNKLENTDLALIDRITLINQDKGGDFKNDENNVMRFRDRVCVPDVPELKNGIHEEGRRSSLSIRPGATKIYKDLKKIFW